LVQYIQVQALQGAQERIMAARAKDMLDHWLENKQARRGSSKGKWCTVDGRRGLFSPAHAERHPLSE
jgi:hypothetical protein